MENSTYWLLTKFSMRCKRRFVDIAENYQLNPFQLFTLCSLEPGHAAPMNYVSSTLLCDASYVTGIVDTLVREGYITRQEDTNDRRVKTIQLTQRGTQLRTQVLKKLKTLEQEYFQALTPTEIVTLHGLFEKLLAQHTGSKS